MNGMTHIPAKCAQDDQRVGRWLLICCAMLFVMVVLGGLTRLTHSGLSMVEWKPLSVLPPMTEDAWREAFAKYQLTPEYLKINIGHGMDLTGYKEIFWLEFIHRNWGRAIGFVFLLPFLYFLFTGRIRRELAPRLGVIFLLGALQGGMGWLMVASGLVDAPNVSQYRLTAHLGFAVLIYGTILWVAMGLLWPPQRRNADLAPLRLKLRVLVGWTAVTILAGGFVAGLGAGLTFNTFPLMNEQIIPDGLWDPAYQPLFRNLFENIMTVQFDHRILAESLLLGVLLVWWGGRKLALPPRLRRAVTASLYMALVQVGLGISTLLLIVPVPLAAAHQAGALALFSLLLWALHEAREPN